MDSHSFSFWNCFGWTLWQESLKQVCSQFPARSTHCASHLRCKQDEIIFKIVWIFYYSNLFMRWHVLNKCRHKFSDLEPIVTKPPPEYPNVLWSEIRMEDNVNISTKSLLQPFYRIGNDLGSRPLCLDSHRSHRTRLCRQYIGIFLFCQVWDKQTSPCDQVISDILKQNLNFTFIS